MQRKPQVYRLGARKAIAGAAIALLASGSARAVKFDTPPDWSVNLDNSLQYTVGWRAQNRNPLIGNHPLYNAGDYKFDKGDLVTNRVQDLIELQASYKEQLGMRLSGSVWKDFAYDDDVRLNPAMPASFSTYPSGHYSNYTKRYHVRGGELLDAFFYTNNKIGDIPTYLKVGRLTQFWGNSFFFGFSNIAYSQSPIDFIKGFSQPGSEVKELFLPRSQVLASADLSPELSVAAQYFFQFAGNRYPEGGTYLGSFDAAYRGPESGGAALGFARAGIDQRAPNNHQNFGVKVAWSPEFAKGDVGFYYRQLDEVHPWILLDTNADGTPSNLHLSYAQKVKLYGISYERTFGTISTGFELSYRRNTALNSAISTGVAGQAVKAGATGDLVNVIANTLIQLGSTPLYDTGNLIAELSYTHLLKVTGNSSLFNGVGYAACAGGGTHDGCATKRALAMAVNFEPQWLQVFPGWDISTPTSLTYGLYGNPAYAAGGFYGQQTRLYSLGIKGNYNSKSSIALQYNGYHWRAGNSGPGPVGPMYTQANGAIALNDRGWIQLTFKTSF